MHNQGNDSHFRIVELYESTRRTDRPHGIESQLFNDRTGAVWAVSELPVHFYKYSTWNMEVVYLGNIRSRRSYSDEKISHLAA